MKRHLKIPLSFFALLASACFDETDITSVQSESFMKYYNNYSVFSGADVKQTPSTGYALLGTVEVPDGLTQICLIRTDEYGNLIDSARYYGRGMNARAYCLQLLPDGGYAILGSSKDQVTGMLQILFIRTDKDGTPIWTSTIKNPKGGNMEARHFVVDALGSFIMTGYAQSSNLNNNKEVLIAALDENGDPLFWSPSITPSVKDDEGRYIQIVNDNYYVITGTTKTYPLGTLYSHSFVMLTNTTGIPPGILVLDATTDEEGNCIRIIDDSNFLVLGTVKNTANGTGTDILLQKVSRSGVNLSQQWERTYGDSGNDYGQCILAENGSIQILGTMTTTGNNTAISMIFTDGEGNNPKYFTFGLGTQLSGTSFEKTYDNGFIISGTNKLSDNSVSFTLIKTRADGSL